MFFISFSSREVRKERKTKGKKKSGVLVKGQDKIFALPNTKEIDVLIRILTK